MLTPLDAIALSSLAVLGLSCLMLYIQPREGGREVTRLPPSLPMSQRDDAREDASRNLPGVRIIGPSVSDPSPVTDPSLFGLCQVSDGRRVLPIDRAIDDLRPVLVSLRENGWTGPVPQKAIMAAMQAYCFENDLRPMGPQALSRALGKLKCARQQIKVPRGKKYSRVTVYNIGGDVIDWTVMDSRRAA
jgi:hypothetical protein